MIDQGVTAALAARDANRSTNGDDNHVSGTGVRRTERVARECTYPDFMKCQPLNFKGTDKCTDKSKITRKQSKTGKHGHENQKSTKPKPEKSSLSQIQSKERAHKCKTRDKSVFPRDSLAQDQALATMKAQIYVGFVLNSLTKLAQTSHQGNDTLAILKCAQVDQTATIDAQMIEEMIGQD
ncbi:hypothetical protein Tco_0366001 [Tanacetum coccineum]